MELDHAVLWVKDAKQSLNFYVDVLGLTPVRAQEFADGKARFPSVRLNEGTIFDIMETSELLPLVQKFYRRRRRYRRDAHLSYSPIVGQISS